MKLEIAKAKAILDKYQLLRKFIDSGVKQVDGITYDSRTSEKDDMFFCKGNFKPEYLAKAQTNGATVYVAETELQEGAGMTALIVTNVAKAMAVLSATYYGCPQDELFIIGITGTKGKTSSAYFTHSILENKYPHQVALFSTIDRIVGPKSEDQFKSDLTTPESMDLFHDMRVSVDNGMKYLVMEVSSQSYLRNRVFGLHFDVGVFLNITPDHIGRNEHKDFEDYLHCKMQLMVNSKQVIINAATDRFADILATAKNGHEDSDIYLFEQNNTVKESQKSDFVINNLVDQIDTDKMQVIANTNKAEGLNIAGEYQVNVPGDYNQENAMAALIASALAGASRQDAIKPLSLVVIPGRMEHLKIPHHGMVFVDYAHNFASLNALLRFLKTQYPNGMVRVVVGSPGDKGLSRRAGFGQALSAQADVAYLTTDDPGFENPDDILNEIEENITPGSVEVHRVLDRKRAIEQAIEGSNDGDVVVLAGKGEDPYQKVRGVDTPWPTDMKVAEDFKRGL